MCIGLMKPKCYFFVHQQNFFWCQCLEKKGWSLCREGEVGCVGAGSTGNIVRVKDRMDSTKYQEILEANIQRSVQILKLKIGWVFQQDNDLKHTLRSQTCCTCKEAKEYFRARGVLPGRMGKYTKSKHWKTLSKLQEELQAVIFAWGVTNWQGSQTFAQGVFPITLNCENVNKK